MRAVIVSDFGSVNGGAAKVAIESARGLAEAGVEIVFACAIGPVCERLDHPLITVEPFAGEEIWQVAGKVAAARQGIWNARAHAFLSDLLARQPRRGTLVHLHQWTKAFSPAAIAAAGESGLPVAITMHDYFSFCPVGGYFDFKANAPCRLKPMSPACIASHCDRASYLHKLVRVARQWRSDEAMRRLSAPLFIHVSDFARRFAEPFLPKQARHVVIENMMEARKRPPADVAANRHALFLGRFTQEKAGDVLARAAAEAGMPVRFVGEGPLAGEIARINPEAEIRGWVAAERVFDEIAQARCLVLPSLWYEPGPLVVAEARSLGVPVVLARTTGPASWIADGEDGILVDGGDSAGLAAALARLRDDNLAGTMGASAYRRYWSDPLTTDRHVGRTLESYRDLVGET
ncbi:glycosyltransferase family 4 protein [Bosea sp. (in: a-proteobacteria)]|uniref:glycosyltransferase family 4 protein n=1 Tax=Bosea sp. (in: a-proteobacteria) TaxID=1871050 RepID=UPI0026267A0F|nr:glycosyltransferase family 4 protein [Bosea sp. (in: a-proteobacteria)]MCO5093015.1 glycosyltransferase family 4 protein [Bosea sp. (in: a-proteobacteria)]